MKKLTVEDYVTASGKYPERSKSPDLTSQVLKNAEALLEKVNAFVQELGVNSIKVSSGFRPSGVNASIGGAKLSNHMTGNAVDLTDQHGELRDLFLKHLEIAKKYNLYFEDFRWTPGWVHVQNLMPLSKNRIFIPSTQPATEPRAWSGSYDIKFN